MISLVLSMCSHPVGQSMSFRRLGDCSAPEKGKQKAAIRTQAS